MGTGSAGSGGSGGGSGGSGGGSGGGGNGPPPKTPPHPTTNGPPGSPPRPTDPPASQPSGPPVLPPGADRGKHGGERMGGVGHYTFAPDGVSSTVDSDRLDFDVRHILASRVRREYFRRQLCSATLEVSFKLGIELCEDTCAVAERFEVPDGPGVLPAVVEAVAAEGRAVEPDQRLRDVARNVLEDFLMLAVGDDLDVYLTGDCRQVQAALRDEIAEQAPAQYLGRLLWRLLEREIERLPEDRTERLIELTSQIANELLSAYTEACDTAPEAKAKVELEFLARICIEEIEGIPAVDWLLGEVER